MPEHALPTAQTLAIKRFVDQTLTFYFSVAPGSIAGLTFTFTLKKKRGASMVTIFSDEITITDFNPDDNEVCGDLDLAAEDTDLAPGTYYWDVRTQEEPRRAPYAHGLLIVESTASH